jgi:hypothetical protein
MNKLKALIVSLALLTTGVPMLAPAVASALPTNSFADSLKSDACSGLDQIDSTQGCGNGKQGIDSVVRSVVNILSFIVGIVAVIMIIVGGLKFVTANGDSSRAASARTTLIYALIGVAVAALAQVLVRFVLSASNT